MKLETAQQIVKFFDDHDIEAEIYYRSDVDYTVEVESDNINYIITEETIVSHLHRIVANVQNNC